MKRKQKKTSKKSLEPKFKSYSWGEICEHWRQIWKKQAGDELKKINGYYK